MLTPLTNAQSSVLVIGDVAVDLLVQIPPRVGDHPDNPEPELHGGGTGANVAVALARLGCHTALMGTVGDDGYGRVAVEGLIGEDVDTAYLYPVHHAFTTIVLGLIGASGARTLFGWPRRGSAHTRLHPDQVTAEVVGRFDWVHTTGLCLIEPPASDAILKGLGLAREMAIPVSCDLNLRLGFQGGRAAPGYIETLRRAIRLSDYVLGSADDEFPLLTETGDIEELLPLLPTPESALIARSGGGGARAIIPAGFIHQPAFSVPVVDTVGAGDAFDAGFVYAQLAGADLATSLRWGNAVAALTIRQRGARSAPARAQLCKFLEEMAKSEHPALQ